MDVMEVIEKRKSIRAYQEKPIPEEKLRKLLEAARLAPSARNAQPYKYIVVKDAKLREKLAQEATPYHFIGEAPVIIIAVALRPDYVMRSEVPAYAVDIGIAFDHITLAAIEEGLGTCWIGGFYQEPVKKILNIPERYKVVAMLPVGYPAESPSKKPRKSLDELICYDTFKE